MARPASAEDGLGQERGDDPVRRVHDLADLEIDGHAREDVRLLARDAALAHEVLDHVADGLLGGGEEIGAVGGGHEPGSPIRPWRERPLSAELTHGWPWV